MFQFNKLSEMISDWMCHNSISFQAEASFKSSIKKSKENFSISELFKLFSRKLNFLCACFTCKFDETKIRLRQEAIKKQMETVRKLWVKTNTKGCSFVVQLPTKSFFFQSKWKKKKKVERQKAFVELKKMNEKRH